MSKTYRGDKGSGFDYWYREANSDGKWCTKPGRFSKKIINKRSRSKIKHKLKNGDYEDGEGNSL